MRIGPAVYDSPCEVAGGSPPKKSISTTAEALIEFHSGAATLKPRRELRAVNWLRGLSPATVFGRAMFDWPTFSAKLCVESLITSSSTNPYMPKDQPSLWNVSGDSG